MKRCAMHRVVAAAAVAAAAGACQGPPGALFVPEPVPPGADFPRAIACPAERAPGGDVALPKNIVLVMGDGMGPIQVEAGRIQKAGPLAWDALAGPVFVNTDSLTTDRAEDPDGAPTDSAASATAMATGTRVANGVVSVDDQGRPLETVLEMAQARGKAVGLVTTSYLYDASPMAFAAHASSRGMHRALVDQLLGTSSPDVIMGGALDLFAADDGAYERAALAAGYHVVHDAGELSAWNPATQPRLLGLFDSSYESLAPVFYDWATTPVAKRDASSRDPLLPEMVDRALERLSRDDDGFFLFIENEHIDTLGHISIVERDLARFGMPREVVVLSDAVERVLAWVAAHSSFDDTLVVVTADHETGDYWLLDADLVAAFFLAITHTRRPVALWAAGPGSDNLDAICRVSDIHHLLTGRLPAGGRASAAP